MNDSAAILNEAEARDAKATVAEIDRALSSERFFEPIIAGLPVEVVDGYRRALASQRADLQAQLDAYEAAKDGDPRELIRRAGDGPGVALVVARIARGFSQKELARRLGVKEQQIQRYEADRYKSISLSNYRRVAHVLDVVWKVEITNDSNIWGQKTIKTKPTPHSDSIRTIIKHAKKHGWFDNEVSTLEGEESYNYLQRYINEFIINHGSPSLLRTGLNVDRDMDDLILIAWKSRVTRRAEEVFARSKSKYRGLDITWLHDLVRCSLREEGPALARDYLLQKGIVVIAEPQISGLKLDGAAFLVGHTPVIGLTLRRDTIDNFWFTLFHELGHVILHYRHGLQFGFYDDTEKNDNVLLEDVEQEANSFAANVMIPDEVWKCSPTRISRSEEAIDNFAKDVGVHPAIVFGRIQRERKNYAVFSNRIGRGLVRKWLLEPGRGTSS